MMGKVLLLSLLAISTVLGPRYTTVAVERVNERDKYIIVSLL